MTTAIPSASAGAAIGSSPPPQPAGNAPAVRTTLVQNLREDRVNELRLREACLAEPSTPVTEVVRCMVEKRAGCVLVVHEGRLAGIFTERDFVNRVVTQSLDPSIPIEKVMTRDPATVPATASVLAAVELMAGSGRYRHLPVIAEDGQPVGVLSVKDVVHYLVEYFPARVYNLPPTPNQQAQPSREGA